MTWKPTNKKSRMTSWMPEWLHLIFRVSLRLGLLCLVIFSLGAGYYYYKASQFDLSKVAEEQLQNTFIDCNGYPLQHSALNSQSLITKDDLPPHLVDALIAREDASFETHCGVDFKGLARATVRNAKDLSFTQGASTLSMQLARNTYEIRSKSLNRKFLEIALTLRIENHYSKPEIMAYYLNRIYFGSGCYGIEQASQKYFKKPTKDLNLSESATIVGIIRGPHIFSPLRNLEAATEQRNQVLDRMVAIDKIDHALGEKVKASALVLPKRASSNTGPQVPTTNGYAIKSLDRHLDELLEEESILGNGLTIQSSLDIAILHQCENSIKKLLHSTKDEELQVACVVLDHSTGAIRAIIGGRDFSQSTFNRALDGEMDLGDAFTPFIYSAALERSKLPIKGKPAQTGRQLKPEETIRIAKRFGLTREFNIEGLFYGSGATNPLELATAFSVLSNKGQRPHTYFVQNIIKRDGSILFSNSASSSPAVLEGTARETLKLLSKKNSTSLHTTDAFKGRSLWSCASQGKLTAVLWLGYDQPRPVPNRKKLLRQMEEITYQWVN